MYLCGVLLNLAVCMVMICNVTPTLTQSLAKTSSKKHDFPAFNINKTAQVNHNITYFDTPDNSMHVPFQKQGSVTKKKLLKTQKRTVQKIIKKQKSHKKYGSGVVPSTMTPTAKTPVLSVKNKATTTEPHKRKWSTKVARYHMPFQKLHKTVRGQRSKRKVLSSGAFYPQDDDKAPVDNNNSDMNSDNGNNYRDLYNKFQLWN